MDADTLIGQHISDPFLVDTTPPVLGTLVANLAGDKIHVIFEAHDALTPIAHAEYSIDAGDWQYLEPVGKISDALTEVYSFDAPLPHPASSSTPVRSGEHVLAVRIYDRADNAVTGKAIVKP